MTDAPLFSRPRNDAPWWVLPILAFFSGLAIPMAVLMTVNATPDFQRGSAEGYAIGRSEAADDQNQAVRQAYFDGIRHGYSLHERGEPLPMLPRQ